MSLSFMGVNEEPFRLSDCQLDKGSILTKALCALEKILVSILISRPNN